jgi:Ca-activated chloride channel family protein
VSARLAPLLLLTGWIALPSLPGLKPHLPAWVERWLYNPRARTQLAVDDLTGKHPDTEEAADAADTAYLLAPGDPRTGFNAGTAHLADGRAAKAAKLLEPAAKALDKQAPEVAPAAWYNLGNAQLKAGDAAAAVEAYRQALLRNPDDADAKWNLELALRDREKERLRAKGGRPGSRGDQPGEREQSQKPGEGDPSDRRDKNPQDPGQGQQGQQQSQGQQGPRSQPAPQAGGQQPQFRNQPEMSSREAAALLSAVENLERRQRRTQAAQRSKQKAAKGKDW